LVLIALGRRALSRIELEGNTGPVFLSAKDAKDAKKAGAFQGAWAFHGAGRSDTLFFASFASFADKNLF
jgi:hypothetical protein